MASNWAYVGCSDFATGSGPTGSVQFHGPDTSITGSYNFMFHTASYEGLAPNTLVLTGTLVVTGTISASHYHIKDVTMIDGTGSTKFGDSLDDTHIRTGSLLVSSSYTNPTSFMTQRVGIGTLNPSGTLHIQVGAGAGAAAAALYDDIVIDSDGDAGVTLLTPGGSGDAAAYAMGIPGDTIASVFYFDNDGGRTVIGAAKTGHSLEFQAGNAVIGLVLDANRHLTASNNLIVTDAILVDPDAGASELSRGVISASAGITGSAFLADGAVSAGNIVSSLINSAADITLDAGGNDIRFRDGSGYDVGTITMGGSYAQTALIISASLDDSGLELVGPGGPSDVSVLTQRNILLTTTSSLGEVRVVGVLTASAGITGSAFKAAGDVSAGAFYGDGSGLTGIGGGLFTAIDGSNAYITSSVAIGGTTAPDHTLSVSGTISASAEVSASIFYGSGMGLSPISAQTTNPYRILTSDGSGNGRLGDNSSDAMITATHFFMGMSGTPTFVSAFTGSVVISGTYGPDGAPSQTLLDVYGVNSASILFVTGSNRVGIGTSSPDTLLHLYSDSPSAPVLKIENEQGGSNPVSVQLLRNTSSPADDDFIGQIDFRSMNDAGTPEEVLYAYVTALSTDITDGEEDGELQFHTMKAGVLNNTMTLQSGLVGIGSGTPTHELEVVGAISASAAVSASAYYGRRLHMGTDTVNTGLLSVVAGGTRNEATDDYAVVAGGYDNTATATYTFVGGGVQNNATATQASVVGGNGNDVTQQQSFIGGGASNTVAAAASAIVGGSGNRVDAGDAFIGAGNTNYNTGQFGALCAGYNNVVGGSYSFVGAGKECTASAAYAVVGGGYRNKTTGDYGAVLGGLNNTSSAQRAFVLGTSGSNVSGKDSIAIGSDLTITERRYIVIGSSVAGTSIVLSGSTTAHGAVSATAGLTGSAVKVDGAVSGGVFYGDGSNLSGVSGFPFTGDAQITGSLAITGSGESELLAVAATGQPTIFEVGPGDASTQHVSASVNVSASAFYAGNLYVGKDGVTYPAVKSGDSSLYLDGNGGGTGVDVFFRSAGTAFGGIRSGSAGGFQTMEMWSDGISNPLSFNATYMGGIQHTQLLLDMTNRASTFSGSVTIYDDDLSKAGLTVTGSTRLSGSFAGGYRRVSDDYQIAEHLYTNYIIGVSGSLSSPVRITLPSASVGPGHTLIIKDEDYGTRSEANAITASISGSTDLVEGDHEYYLYGSMGSITLYSDGIDKWFVV